MGLRPVVGYEDLYSVTDDGRVWSHPKQWVDKSGRYQNNGNRWLQPGTDSSGYLLVVLVKNGTHKSFRIHRLVAMAWHLNPDGLPIVNHKDGIKTNNDAANLEWSSYSGNARHAFASGIRCVTDVQRTRASALGKSTRKLSLSDAAQIKQLYASGLLQREIAAQFGVNQPVISNILNGRTYAV